jgi:NTP pyrophosphatase (non-canonical NTP hydrolase)
MELNKLRDMIHENAVEKGFYELEDKFITSDIKNPDGVYKGLRHAFFAQKIALIHSELSEALEADRKNKWALMKTIEKTLESKGWQDVYENYEYDKFVKGSVEDELSDVIIRTLDLCGYLKIDIEKHIKFKMEYNKLRGYKHGKEY